IYYYYVSDFNGCIYQDSAIVNGPDSPLKLNVTSESVTCYGKNDGKITTSFTGGTPPYINLWTSYDYSSNEQNLSSLESGIYYLNVHDKNGCLKDTMITIHEPAEITANYIVTNPSCIGNTDGTIELSVMGGYEPYIFDYQIGQLPDLNFDNGQFDAIALIYAHFPPNIKSEYHKILDRKLKKGGTVLFEAFGKNHLEYRKRNPDIGGPPDLDSLFSTDELKSDFGNYEILELVETEVELKEGLYHNGKGSVTRFIGRKK
ncbi:MAG: SprB repeat-containing protein, partial [Spirochaetales bacterium]|nr:SprB repeat-containing protein [Spirochaetales bacterium]